MMNVGALEELVDRFLPDGNASFSLAQLIQFCQDLGEDNPLVLRHKFQVVEA